MKGFIHLAAAHPKTQHNCISNVFSVISDETTSQSTKPASWQVAGYAANCFFQSKGS
jgi:hypothetical protein